MRYLLTAFLLLALIAGSFLTGSWFKEKQTASGKAAGLKTQSRNDGHGLNAYPEAEPDAASLPPGTVRITPDKQQLVGVRIGVVEKTSVEQAIRTVGRVAADEKRVYRLVSGTDGWIRQTFNNDTWSLVKKGERLATFYSPLLRSAMIAYISLLGSAPEDRFRVGGRQALTPAQQASITFKTYIDSLESLGMTPEQINELAHTKQVTDDVFIIAPETGFIIARNVSPGQQFGKGFEWYRLADLRKVWILVDLYGGEAEHFRPGLSVKVSLPDRGRSFSARVSNVLPQFDPATRTQKLRLETDNPDFMLRPDMFVDVELPVKMPPALTVPADAILDSGLKKTVFVDRGNGFFEPRPVKTGWRLGNWVEILQGLAVGERIVLSGTFLLDSESRMDLAAAGASEGLARDPVSGMEVSIRKSEKTGLKTIFRGQTYYFSSPDNRTRFNQDPGRFVGKQPGS